MFDHDDDSDAISGVSVASGVGELDDLSYALTLLGKVDWSSLPGDVAVDALADITMLGNRLAAASVELIGEVDRTRALAEAGFRNAAGFLRKDCHVPKVEAARRRTLAARLRCKPALAPVGESFAAGRIGFAQASLIARYSTLREIAWAFDDAVTEFFVPTAEANDFEFFKRACEAWYERVDETQGDARAKRHRSREKMRVSPSFDGMVRVDGWLPPIAGETFANEFERLRRYLYDRDWAVAKDELGRDPKPDELGRTADQRSIAVFELMAQRSASYTKEAATNLACVNVLMDFDMLHAASREFVGLPAMYPANGICQTESGTPVTPRDAIETLLKGHIRRVVFDPESMRMDFGRKTRYFQGGLREAVMIRDQTCVEPGCDVPARFCEIDHCTSWVDLGETTVLNANARCRFHNGLKGRRSTKPVVPDFSNGLSDSQTDSVGFRVEANEKWRDSSAKPMQPPDPRDAAWVSRK